MPTIVFGSPLIPMPTDPSAPAAIDWIANDSVAVSTSPFTGQQQVQNWVGSWLEGSVQMPAMTHTQAQAWISWLMGLTGPVGVFQLGDPLGTIPAGSASGSPVVSGASQIGYALVTRGWTASATGVLLPGDWVQIGFRLYRTVLQVNADTGGNATINLWPNLRESPADGAALTLSNTKGLFRLKSNQRKWSVNQFKTYGVQFDIREAI